MSANIGAFFWYVARIFWQFKAMHRQFNFCKKGGLRPPDCALDRPLRNYLHIVLLVT